MKSAFAKTGLVILLAILALTASVYAWFWGTEHPAIGSYRYDYELVAKWPQLADEKRYGKPTGLAFHPQGKLLLLHRADREWPWFSSMDTTPIQEPVVWELSADDGKLLNSWGERFFAMPHGLRVDEQGNIWITDLALHQVFKFSSTGVLLLSLGQKGVKGEDSTHFNQPTDVAIGIDGSIFVSDGYGNHRIIRFDSTGKYLKHWGTKGSAIEQLHTPHNLLIDHRGMLLVADRENKRIQVFNPDGVLQASHCQANFGNVVGLGKMPNTNAFFLLDDPNFLGFIHYGSHIYRRQLHGKNFGPLVLKGDDKRLTRWYHAIAIDSTGNLFVADIGNDCIQKFSPLLRQ